MKTKELYLLLILFYNVFSDAPTMTNSISIDSINTELTTTNSDTSLSTTDSPSTNSDTSLSTTDSSTTNLDTSLSTTDSSSTNSDTSLSTPDSSPTKSDTSLSNTDSSSANSDISLSTIDSSNGNSTLIPDQPRIVLIGFGLYQRLLRDLVTFRVYFKRFLTRASSRYLYFTVVMNYLRRLRVLEEQRANCTLITDNNNDMAFNCSVPVDANKDFRMSAKDDFEFSDLEPNLIVSSYANSTMKSLSSKLMISLEMVF